jgi:hypothetical protein
VNDAPGNSTAVIGAIDPSMADPLDVVFRLTSITPGSEVIIDTVSAGVMLTSLAGVDFPSSGVVESFFICGAPSDAQQCIPSNVPQFFPDPTKPADQTCPNLVPRTGVCARWPGLDQFGNISWLRKTTFTPAGAATVPLTVRFRGLQDFGAASDHFESVIKLNIDVATHVVTPVLPTFDSFIANIVTEPSSGGTSNFCAVFNTPDSPGEICFAVDLAGACSSCAAGDQSCTCGGCVPPFADCDGDFGRPNGNGCETNLDSNSDSCGSCGHACDCGFQCSGGRCIQDQICAVCPPDHSVLTQHNRKSRDGGQLVESALTPAAVGFFGMRLQCSASITGGGMAQPLYAEGVSLNGGPPTDALYVASTSNTLSAFDVAQFAVNGGDCGAAQWHTTLPDDDFAGANLCGCQNNCQGQPFTSMPTPVIDPCRNRIYMMFGTKDPNTGHADAYYVAVLDMRDGSVLGCQAINATATDSLGDSISFVPTFQYNRAGLLLDEGSLYVAFGNGAGIQCGEEQSHGWVMRYLTLPVAGRLQLSQQGVVADTMEATAISGCNGKSYGGGIWQAGGGLVGAGDGDVFAFTGNGHIAPSAFSYGDSLLRLAPSGNGLVVSGNYSPDATSDPNACASVHADASFMEERDLDLASGGPLKIPGTRLIAGGGKTGIVYLVDPQNMSLQQSFQGTQAMANSQCSANDCAYCRCVADCGGDSTCVTQCGLQNTPAACSSTCRCCGASCDLNDCRYDSWDTGPHLHGSPTFWQTSADDGYLYLWGEKDNLRGYHFSYQAQRFDHTGAPAIGVDRTNRPIIANPDTMPGGMISLSAQGQTNGIVWATLPGLETSLPQSTPPPGHLYAFGATPDAQNRLPLLWDTAYPSQLALGKWTAPTIANGLVFVATGGTAGSGSDPRVLVYQLGTFRRRPFPLPPFGVRRPPISPPGPLKFFFPTEAAIAATSGVPFAATQPPGERAVLTANAEGFEIWTGTSDGWRLVSTTASLFEVSNGVLRRLGRLDGEHWTMRDGTRLTTTLAVEAPAGALHSVPWQRLAVTRRGSDHDHDDDDDGVFARVRSIQRIATLGGEPPPSVKPTPGKTVQSRFTAQYVFYAR